MLKQTARRVAILLTVPLALMSTLVVASPASASVAGTAAARASLKKEIVTLTNKQRAKAGCRPVIMDNRLMNSANNHSRDMADKRFFSHRGSDGSTFVVRAKRQSYQHAQSENIAWGYRSASEVVGNWMKSPGHRKNILTCSVKKIGVGVAPNAKGVPYYTQVFGRS